MTDGFPPGPNGRDGSSAMGLPRVGTMFAGYGLEGVLGRGGMSVVFRADNARLGNKVALKVLAPELSEDDTFRERFVRESRVAASISHPNIIPIYDAGDSDGLLYIVMRYVDGDDLKALLRREGPLPVARACALVSQVGGALYAAHQRGLIHRDIKPGNILIERTEGKNAVEHVYLADFGLTKHAQSRSGLTQTGQFMGTVDYVAPEQIEGKPVDRRADLYSLGCVLYECLTGIVPFQRDSDVAVLWAHVQDSVQPPSSVRADLPPGTDEIVARAMAKSPDDRYQTAADLVSDLNQLGREADSRTPRSRAGWSQVAPSVPAVSDPGSGSRLTPPAQEAASFVQARDEPVGAMPDRAKRSVRMVAAAVAGVVVLVVVGLFVLSQGSSKTVAGTQSGSGSGGSSGQAGSNMSIGTGNPAMLTAYVQPSVWAAYHCQRQMPPAPIRISSATAPLTGLLDSATCRFARGNITLTLNLFKTDADSSAGWHALLGPTALVPSRTASCNRYSLKSAGIWRHMDMKGARPGGWKFCDLSANGTGYIVWTVKSEATANPSGLTHSLLLSAFQPQGTAKNMLGWWHSCRHQLGEGTGVMLNMPTCPT
jgi:serine/threonine protein kinase